VVLEPGTGVPFRFDGEGALRNQTLCVWAAVMVLEPGYRSLITEKPPGGWVVTVGLITSGHRIFRVVSCCSRSHPRPLSERLGRGVSDRSSGSPLPLLQTRYRWGKCWGSDVRPMRFGLSINDLTSAHAESDSAEASAHALPYPAISLQLIGVAPPLGAVTSTSIGAARTRASPLGHQQIWAGLELPRSG
jgi:hypothetical protein